MKNIKLYLPIILSALCFLIFVGIGYIFFGEDIMIDDCFDRGGRWNYDVSQLIDILLSDFWSIFLSIIGCLTGVISLRRVTKMKSLDLRLQRGKIINELSLNFKECDDLLNEANKSKERCLAAMGKFQSGEMNKWRQDFKAYNSNLTDLKNDFKDLSSQISSIRALKKNIIELDSIKRQVQSIFDKAQSSIKEDDKNRDRLHRMKFGS